MEAQLSSNFRVMQSKFKLFTSETAAPTSIEQRDKLNNFF